MKVVFRVDASVQIGTGHVMRCLTLADELSRQGHRCLFICRDHKGHLGKLITSKDFELHILSASEDASPSEAHDNSAAHAKWLGVSWQQDAEQTLELLTGQAADWLVVDHYALDAQWEQQLATAVGRIMVIDDLADRNHECALLLDQNLGRNAADYDQRVPDYCIRLIGPRYALLRPEFSMLRERSLQRRSQPELKRILISLGGVDRTDVTGQVLAALAETPSLPQETELDIIMGATAPYLREVQQQAAQLPFRATVSVNVNDMAERMCLADLSIGAAGSTSWERCCMGLPTLLVVLADNQVSGGKALEAAGAAFVVGGPEVVRAVMPDALMQVCKQESLKQMSMLAAGLTTGKGAAEVVGSMMESAGRHQ